ncbi:MAG: alpha/beta hydrolase [Pseudomonadaceae bacterium]|jgi:pimeloyl-ACP methyl ester carboxylesterase|nr:alpha/beta hydrolase [Pseudomonadaceae bacterium]
MPLLGMALADWRSQGRDFVFNGHEIRYWTTGQGAPLLLIHGFPTAAWDWHYLWAPLAERYQLIACDMLGFGDSAKPRPHAYSLLEQADLQQALLAHLGIVEPVHLLAHDYGDSVAQELVARHTDGRIRLASCVFLNGGLFPETHRPLLAQRLLLSPLGPLLGRLFSRQKLARSFSRIFGPDTQASATELDAFWSLLTRNNGPAVLHLLIRYMPERRVHRDRWLAAMQRNAVPLCLIDGGLDPISGRHMLARYRELVPNADWRLLDTIGHYPQIEAPALVLQHYLQFRQQLAVN